MNMNPKTVVSDCVELF